MKDPRWKQKNPVDQLTAIRASLQGHFENWIDLTIGDAKLTQQVDDHLKQIAALEPFLRHPENW